MKTFSNMHKSKWKGSFLYIASIVVVIAALYPLIGIMVKSIIHFTLGEPSELLVSEDVSEMFQAHADWVINRLAIYFQLGVILVFLLVIVINRTIKNLKKQKWETEDILQTLGEGVIATDVSGRVVFINQSACQMLGVRSEEIYQSSLESVKKSDLAYQCHELISRTLERSESIVEMYSTKKGIPVHLDLISAPLRHVGGALIVIQNKTSEYKIIQMGKDFVANASHELRTPITIIKGFAETLQDLPKISQEMLAEITEKIVRTCSRLERLVKSLLTLADIENLSEERMQEVNLVMLAENCERTLALAYPNVNVTLKSDERQLLIHAEGDLIELAIWNLLENAVKYSESAAQIEMRIWRVNGDAFLTIRDEGIGISEADLPHIFDRFYTVNKARSRKLGGAGLGLSIVKTIIEKHHGKILVTSELGKGTVFTIIFREKEYNTL